MNQWLTKKYHKYFKVLSIAVMLCTTGEVISDFVPLCYLILINWSNKQQGIRCFGFEPSNVHVYLSYVITKPKVTIKTHLRSQRPLCTLFSLLNATLAIAVSWKITSEFLYSDGVNECRKFCFRGSSMMAGSYNWVLICPVLNPNSTS